MVACDLMAASTHLCPANKSSLGAATYVPKKSELAPSQLDYVNDYVITWGDELLKST